MFEALIPLGLNLLGSNISQPEQGTIIVNEREDNTNLYLITAFIMVLIIGL